jgi:S1-C subfamily serine protease
MSRTRNRLSLDHGLRASRRRAGLAAVITVATLAGLLMVPGGSGLAQDAKAQGAQEAKLGLGDLINRANQGVVLINIENRSGQKVAFGSGFLIDDKGLVATNFHVVAQAAKARVVFEFKDGNTAGVKCMRAYDKKRDLAI